MSVFSNRSADPPSERARYAGAILDLLGNNHPLTVLRQTPTAVAQAIGGLTPAQLRTPEGPDKWSVVQCCNTWLIPIWCGDGACD